MEFVYFQTNDAAAAGSASQLLPEGRTYSINNKWSVRADKPHTTGMQNHNHIQCNGNEIAVVNQDGSPSHSSDLSVVPNWVLGWIKIKGLTESYLGTVTMPENVPAAVIAEALRQELLVQKSVELLNRTSGQG
jgi:hypothetical protein